MDLNCLLVLPPFYFIYLFIYFTDILFLDSFKKCNFFCYEQISYYI